jgi:hypothetical protein
MVYCPALAYVCEHEPTVDATVLVGQLFAALSPKLQVYVAKVAGICDIAVNCCCTPGDAVVGVMVICPVVPPVPVTVTWAVPYEHDAEFGELTKTV